MDVHCPKCGEPWDLGEFPYIAEELGVSRAKVSQDFRERGCQALGTRCSDGTGSILATRVAEARAAYELLGDDMDGAASILGD